MTGAICTECGCYISQRLDACPACGKRKIREVKAVFIGVNGEAVKVWEKEQGVIDKALYEKAAVKITTLDQLQRLAYEIKMAIDATPGAQTVDALKSFPENDKDAAK